MAFGDHYKGLENEKGENQYSGSSIDLTTQKQQSQEEIGKSRETINKYTRMSDNEGLKK